MTYNVFGGTLNPTLLLQTQISTQKIRLYITVDTLFSLWLLLLINDDDDILYAVFLYNIYIKQQSFGS